MTQQEYDRIIKLRATYITEEDEKDMRRLARCLNQMHDMLIENGLDSNVVGLLAEAAYSISLALDCHIDNFVYRMPEDNAPKDHGELE